MAWLHDARTDCWSVMLTVLVREYLELVRKAHDERGALEGQREVLKTTTAKRIRERMISDIQHGAVLPPVVIGIVVDNEKFKNYPIDDDLSLSEIIGEATPDISIIDGMQRTASLIEAAQTNESVLDRPVRVELWLSKSVRAMIYRMLVLNTGQVPWTLSRQLTVVYDPLIKEIQKSVDEIEKISSPDKKGKRVSPAQYSAADLVELYLAFSLRKTAVDTKEALSEEFSRLDFIENLSSTQFQEQFYTSLSLLARLDTVFSKYDPAEVLAEDGVELKKGLIKGRNIFDRQPAKVGFVVAMGVYVLGRPGMDRTEDDRSQRIADVEKHAIKFVESLEKKTPDEIGQFLQLEILGEVLNKRVGQVGRYERGVFFDAFKVFIDEGFDLPSMEPCWRAN